MKKAFSLADFGGAGYNILAIGVLIFVTLMFYARVVEFEYLWDDYGILHTRINSLVSGTLSFVELGCPFLKADSIYFRPLVILTYYLDVRLTGYNPGFSHGVNLVLFILNTLLIFSVCKCLAERMERKSPVFLAFVASLLYIIHPAMIEAATWISGRFDLLVTFFILGATRVYIGSIRKWVKIALVALLLFLAFLCKETGVVSPVAMLCIWIALADRNKPKNVYLDAIRENSGFLLAVFLALGMYLVLRWQVRNNVLENAGNFNYMKYLYEYGFWAALEAVKFYLISGFFPFLTNTGSGIHPVNYVLSPGTLSDVSGNILALIVMVGLLYFAVRKHSCAAWIFIAGFIYLIPVLHIVPLPIRANFSADRFLTAPLAFWVISVALTRYDQIFLSLRLDRFSSALRFFSIQRISWLLAICWILSSAFTTFYRIPLWENSLQFWGTNHSLYPDDIDIHEHYINTILEEERRDLIEKELKENRRRIEDADMDIRLLLSYGKLLMATRDPAALPFLEKVINLNPVSHIHEQPAPFEQEMTTEFRVVSGVVAYLYSLYSEAILLFERDPDRALEVNEVANWYASMTNYDLVRLGIKPRRIAYLYAKGMMEEGAALEKEMESISDQYETDKAHIASILEYYCQDSASDACKAFFLRDNRK